MHLHLQANRSSPMIDTTWDVSFINSSHSCRSICSEHSGVHDQISDKLLLFLEHLQSEVILPEQFLCLNIADHPSIVFSFRRRNFAVRKLVFAAEDLDQLEVTRRQLSLQVLLQLQSFIPEGVELFRSPTAIRHTVCHKTESSFFALVCSQFTSRESVFAS
jgi:hypothetical protein